LTGTVLRPILGEDIYQIFSGFERKYNVFSHFLPFSKIPLLASPIHTATGDYCDDAPHVTPFTLTSRPMKEVFVQILIYFIFEINKKHRKSLHLR